MQGIISVYRWSTKKVLNTLSNFELKILGSFMKVTFRIVKDLFKWIEGPSRSVIILVVLEAEIKSNIGDLRKKYLTRCQFRAQKYSCAVSWKVTFSLVKDLFKWIEGPSRSVIILVVRCRDNIGYRWSTKSTWHVVKFRAQKILLCSSWKVTFSLVKDLFKWIEGLSRSVIILVGSEAEIISNIGDLRKST